MGHMIPQIHTMWDLRGSLGHWRHPIVTEVILRSRDLS